MYFFSYLSLKSGLLPEYWKEEKVSLTFKKRDHVLMSLLIPVSLTSVCCRTWTHYL